uniref:Uncharacterized protein n=1 Tax=Arundo donax TaxID=35708 RepID=A0A0A9CHN5_ARUDO
MQGHDFGTIVCSLTSQPEVMSTTI